MLTKADRFRCAYAVSKQPDSTHTYTLYHGKGEEALPNDDENHRVKH